MSLESVCRVCLSNEKRMKKIANTQLQTLFEKLTSNQLITSDGRPESVCYICHILLLKCCKFVELSQTSEEFLTQLVHNGFELTQETLTNSTIRKNAPYTITASATIVSIPNVLEVENSNVKIKIEPVERKFVVIDTENALSVQNDYMDIDKQEHELTSSDADTPQRNDDSTAGILDGNGSMKFELESDLNSSERDEDLPDNSFIITPKRSVTCRKGSMDYSKKHNNTTEKRKKEKAIKNKKSKIRKSSYDCDNCPKTFRRKAYLKKHIRIHISERPYACHICSKIFSHQSTLKRHIMTHTGKKKKQKQFACHICCKTFRDRGYLPIHIRTHTGERPYVCHICSKTFSRQGTLKRHIMTHTDENKKQFACDICSKTFGRLSNLKRHIMTHLA